MISPVRKVEVWPPKCSTCKNRMKNCWRNWSQRPAISRKASLKLKSYTKKLSNMNREY